MGKSAIKIIVDANIVFSAILNSNGKIGDILINSDNKFEFIAPDFLREEINDKYSRIQKVSGMTLDRIQDTEYRICKEIQFISEEQIAPKHWKSAFELVKDIDPKDTPYIAFSKHFKCKVWSGDKKLMNGLAKKKFLQMIDTDQLFKLKEKSKI